jgi:hypothetical protein
MTKGKQMILEQHDGEHQVLGASWGLGVDSDRIHEIIRLVLSRCGTGSFCFSSLMNSGPGAVQDHPCCVAMAVS